MKNYIYCYYINMDEKIPELAVSYFSLKATNPQYPVYCMLGRGTSPEGEQFLKDIGLNLLDAKDYPYTDTIYDENNQVVSRFICSGKLSIFRFLQFDKIVYLDTDTYVKKNLDCCFEAKNGSMTKFLISEDPHCGIPNGGLLVAVPSQEMIDLIDRRREEGYKTGKFLYYDDQEFLARELGYYHRDDLRLPVEFNAFPFFIDFYKKQNFFNDKEVRMWHFMGGLTFNSINFKLYDAPSLSHYPNWAWDYAQDYLIQYNLILTILKTKYPDLYFLKYSVVNTAIS